LKLLPLRTKPAKKRLHLSLLIVRHPILRTQAS